MSVVVHSLELQHFGSFSADLKQFWGTMTFYRFRKYLKTLVARATVYQTLVDTLLATFLALLTKLTHNMYSRKIMIKVDCYSRRSKRSSVVAHTEVKSP